MKSFTWKRLLSLALTLVMVIGMVSFTTPKAEAAATEYATPATEEELNDVQRWFSTTNGAANSGTYAKIIDGVVYIWGSNSRSATGMTGQTVKDGDGNEYTVTWIESENASGTAIITVPTAMPKSFFNDEKVKLIASGVSTFSVVTENNHVFNWGYSRYGIYNNGYITQADTSAINTGDIVKIRTNGTNWFVMTADGTWYAASSGRTSLLGDGRFTDSLGTAVTASRSKFQKIPQGMLNQFGGGIIDIAGCYAYSVYVIGKDGRLYAAGNLDYSTGIGFSGTLPSYTNPNTKAAITPDGYNYPVCINAYVPALKDVRFTQLSGEDWSASAVATNGDVWGFSNNNQAHLGVMGYYNQADIALPFTDASGNETVVHTCIDETHKVFDHNIFQKKAVRAWVCSYRTAFLCEDNTIYAIGNNNNGIIKAGAGDVVDTVTQILADTSRLSTIVGVFPANQSQMVITKASDMIFAGSNAQGGAGNGKTESAPEGKTTEVVSESLPPSEPLTANEMIFEIEVVQNNITEFYLSTGKKNSDNKMLFYHSKTASILAGGKAETVSPTSSVLDEVLLSLDAGINFKLNVYFRDFGKLNTFVVPIRFDPKYLQVVNGNGTAYSKTLEVVTPGAYGANIGIEQCFDTQDWAGGYLSTGRINGTYPKISNKGGYVSIMGYTTDTVGAINGTVKMFSVAFRAQENTPTWEQALLTIADMDNVPSGVTDSTGYDAAIDPRASASHGAYWSVLNATSAEGISGYFTFKYDEAMMPAFNTTYIPTQRISLQLTYGATNANVLDTLGTNLDPDEKDKAAISAMHGWRINWTNKDVVYTMTATSWGSENRKASFPAVTWTCSLFDENGAEIAAAEGAQDPSLDYITITGTTDTSISFKINPRFTPTTDADGNVTQRPVYVRFVAASKAHDVTSASSDGHVKLKNFAAPGTIAISQSPDSTGTVRTPVNPDNATISTFTFHSTKAQDVAGENRTFWVFYGTKENGETKKEGDVDNSDVVWSLLHSDGTPVDMDAADAVAKLRINDNHSVTITPLYTIKNDDYLILHVESLYDATKFDDIYIKIQLYATSLTFSPETVRMSVATATNPTSTVDLKKLLQIAPVDVYDTDLVWTIDSVPASKPGNWNDDAVQGDGTWVAGTTVNYGSMGSGANAAVFYAYEKATPTVASCGTEQYVRVKVTDNLSGVSGTVKIAIMAIESPIGMELFEGVNAVGSPNDVVKVKGGIELNDVFRFYKTYEDALADKNELNSTTGKAQGSFSDGYDSKAGRETTIVDASMTGSFTFSVGDIRSSLMEGAGGYLYVTITRANTSGQVVTFDPVPVSYGAEPSLVYGYIHLYGRVTGSAWDGGITVGLEGGDFKEYVSTDATGYFKFTKYIAPGDYTMTISKQNYLTRTTPITITADNSAGKFMISSNTNPITLFPGELTSDDRINISDITYYVANWVGLVDDTITNFSLYDFLEDGIISTTDLELLLQRRDWTPTSYPTWVVPKQ